MSEPVLSCRSLSCTAGGRQVVSDVSLDVLPGERVALMGPSGSGKTTLLTALGGLVKPSAGQVLVRGVPISEEPAGRKDIAIVFQSYGLVSLLTAAENVEVALRAAGHAPAEAVARARAGLQRLGVAQFAGHLIEELSGGQQQRVAVARALCLRTPVLLADEPTAEQDAQNRELVVRELLGAAAEGAAVVLATHDPEVAARCDRVVELREGRRLAEAAS